MDQITSGVHAFEIIFAVILKLFEGHLYIKVIYGSPGTGVMKIMIMLILIWIPRLKVEESLKYNLGTAFIISRS